MELLDQLREEHVLIDRMLGSLRAYVAGRAKGEGDPKDAAALLGFFRTWVGYHHHREEEVLFTALVREAELPKEHGPLFALGRQHQTMAAQLEAIAGVLGKERLTPGEAEQLSTDAVGYSRALWAHIDAENSVLFRESERRLKSAGVLSLESRPPGEAELAARDAGAALATRYPPLEDPGAWRGEECVICPSYGVDCDGVEREWWSDHEWDDFFQRNGS